MSLSSLTPLPFASGDLLVRRGGTLRLNDGAVPTGSPCRVSEIGPSLCQLSVRGRTGGITVATSDLVSPSFTTFGSGRLG